MYPRFMQAHLYREASRSIYSGLQSHFNSRTLADISIVRPDGRLIHAHQVILAACSRKLSSVLAYGEPSRGLRVSLSTP